MFWSRQRATAAPAHANVLMVTAVPHASVSPARTTAMAKARATPALACVAVPMDTLTFALFACAEGDDPLTHEVRKLW